MNFWGIIVVFSACAAFQLAESRFQNDYRPNGLSTSDELADISNRIIDSLKDGSSSFAQGVNFEDTSDTQVRLSLSERREELYQFSNNLVNENVKNFVSKIRDVLNELVLELEALTEKSDDVKERLTELKATLKELDGFDMESDDLHEASDIMNDLWDELREPINEPLEVVAALRKVGWIDMDNELSDEMNTMTDIFVIVFNQFVATLTPWEQLTEADLIDLNKRFNEVTTDDRWELFDEFWTYFE